MLRRKFYSQLAAWKAQRQGRSAILIEGARRIGKSYIAEEFARREYDSYILIDFSKALQQVKEWFSLYLEDLDTLLLNIQLHYKKQPLYVLHSADVKVEEGLTSLPVYMTPLL